MDVPADLRHSVIRSRSRGVVELIATRCVGTRRLVLPLDLSCANTRFGKICQSCGQHEYVVGVDGIRLLDISKPIQFGLYRSDHLFGSKCGKHPLQLVGVETKRRIEEERFRGVLFIPLSQS